MIYLDANRLEQGATVYAITEWLKQNIAPGRQFECSSSTMGNSRRYRFVVG